MFVLISAACRAQTAPWQNDWTMQNAPSLQWLQYDFYYQSLLQALQAPLAMSPDGDVLVCAPTLDDDHLVRRIDITGWIRDTDVADPAQLSAIVVGPIGLNELVTADNAVRATVSQSLFFDGFE